MKTELYKIIKRYRGRYQVLDNKGFDLIGNYVSKFTAEHTVIAHKLQDKALKHAPLLRIAESLTSLRDDHLYQWLNNFIIRMEIPEMRKLIQKPSILREMKRQNDIAKAKSMEIK